MTAVIDKKTGQTHDVAPADAEHAFLSGAAELPRTPLSVVLAGGQVGTVPAEKAQEVLRMGGRFAAPSETETAPKGGNFVTAFRAGGVGVGRGLIPGYEQMAGNLSQILGGPSAAEVRDRFRALEEAHPVASLGGEALGLTLQSVATGGGALGAVGGAAERGAAQALGKTAPSLLGRIGQATVKTAARGAAEGALLGALETQHRNYLENTDLTAEKLFAGMGQGALFGGLAGGLMGGAGEGLKATGERLVPLLRLVFKEAAEEQAFRALSARKAFTAEIEKMPGGTKALGRELLDSKLVAPGDTLEHIAPKIAEAREEAGSAIGRLLQGADDAGFQGPLVNDVVKRVREQVLPRLEVMPETNRGAIEAVERALNDFQKYGGLRTVGDAPDFAAYEARALEGLRAEGSVLKGAAELSKARKLASPQYLADVAERDALLAANEGQRVGFGQLQKFRAQLDDLIKWNTNPLMPVNEKTDAYKGMRRALEESLVDAGERAATERGASFAKEYSDAKLRYRRLLKAEQASEDALTRAQANQAHSLTDKIMGAATGAAALATHGPLGLLAGPLASYGSKVIRERGNATAAVLLDRAASYGAIERQIVRVDSEVDNAVAKFFGKKAPPVLKPAAGTTPLREAPAKEYERRVQEVTAAASDKPRATALVLAKTQPLEHLPTVRAAIVDTSMRAAAYLEAHIPQGRVETYSATPHLDKPSVSDIQRQQFLDRARTVSNPMSAVQDFAKGKASREQIEALRVVYPQIYAELVTKVDDELASRKTPVPYQKVIQLSSVLGRGLSASQDPAFIKAMNVADTNPPKGNAPPPPASGPPFKTSTMLQTTTQRVEGR